MRTVAFALSLLVLGSFAAAAQQARPGPTETFLHHAYDSAAIGVGALLGFFAAEPLGVAEIVGVVAGTSIGAWWYDNHVQSARPQLRGLMAAR